MSIANFLNCMKACYLVISHQIGIFGVSEFHCGVFTSIVLCNELHVVYENLPPASFLIGMVDLEHENEYYLFTISMWTNCFKILINNFYHIILYF